MRRRPGPKPLCSDSEVLTLAVVRDLEGETRERRWYTRVAANGRALFPTLPKRRVVQKRTKSLSPLLDRCRCAVRDRLSDPADPRRLLDGTLVPVCAVSRVGRADGSSAGRQWSAYGAEIGRYAARAWWFSGVKLVLSATLALLPDQAVLGPVATNEREATAALPEPERVSIADRTVHWAMSPPWRATLDTAGCAVVAPPPRRLAAEQDPVEKTFLTHVRTRLETLMGLLTSEHDREDHGARSWWGLQSRLAGVLAACTTGRYLTARGIC